MSQFWDHVGKKPTTSKEAFQEVFKYVIANRDDLESIRTLLQLYDAATFHEFPTSFVSIMAITKRLTSLQGERELLGQRIQQHYIEKFEGSDMRWFNRMVEGE